MAELSSVPSTTATTLSTLLTTTVPASDIDPPIRSCNYFVINNNKSAIIDFRNQYGGIPQNLVFNLIGWLVLMLLFAFLRRAAGNYGRWALVRKDQDSEAKWTELFFAPDDVSVEHDESQRNQQNSIDVEYAEEAMEDKRIGAWILSIFTLSDDKYLRKCGVDAVQYLKFQRHLIFFMAIITVACVAIILPINFQGNLQGTNLDFGHTTISNLKGTDERLWVHVVLVILFLPLGIAIMRHFSVNLGIRDDSQDTDVTSRTLMIAGIPDTYCTKEFVHRHITEAYQDDSIVEEVQVAYDVSKLSWLDQKRDNAYKARIYCENHAAKFGAGQQMKPITCGIMCMACNCRGSCCKDPVDALTFYKKEEHDYADEVLREKARVKTKSIGIAFVTFSRLGDARQMLRDHKGKCRCFTNPSSSTLSNLLEPWNWSVRVAPPPEDIYWENLNESHRFFFIKTFVINFFLFLMLFFFTSPAYIISELELILHLHSLNIKLPEKINDFLPTLLLWTLSALLPIIVAYSDWWMGHWRRSVENLWIMRKVFFYLLFMVLILPSIGLTSLRGVVQVFIDQMQANSTTTNVMKWNCIFLPDNGAFFVNYVITSALVGTALEFMRFSELFMYAMRLMFARSVAEVPNVRAANLYEFPFGFNYGWMLLIFALTVAYGVVCPLITPFGLFYLVMKHGVDRYNLFYAYKRSKINKNIHATAVNCVIVSLLIQQLILLFFNVIRGKATSNSSLLNPKAIFSITMFTIFLGLFAAQFFFHLFKGWSPIQYTSQGSNGNNQETPPNVSSRASSEDLNGTNPQSQERQFVGFCNPQDQEMDAPAGSQNNAVRRRRYKDHKKYLPDVLKVDDDENRHGGAVNGAQSNLVTSDSATFAYPEVNEPIRSSSPSYGALE